MAGPPSYRITAGPPLQRKLQVEALRALADIIERGSPAVHPDISFTEGALTHADAMRMIIQLDIFDLDAYNEIRRRVLQLLGR